MLSALNQARKALRTNDVPVGAAAVYQGKIIARGCNAKEASGDPLAHAELICLRRAVRTVGFRLLGDVTFYVTLEPCAMCAGALVLARMGRLVYGTADPKAGAAGSVMNIAHHPRLNHRMPIATGILEDECRDILKTFFKKLRLQKSMRPLKRT